MMKNSTQTHQYENKKKHKHMTRKQTKTLDFTKKDKTKEQKGVKNKKQ